MLCVAGLCNDANNEADVPCTKVFIRERQAAEVGNTGLCILSAFATARTMKLTSLVLRLAITDRQSARTRESSCVINHTYDKQAIATVSL